MSVPASSPHAPQAETVTLATPALRRAPNLHGSGRNYSARRLPATGSGAACRGMHRAELRTGQPGALGFGAAPKARPRWTTDLNDDDSNREAEQGSSGFWQKASEALGEGISSRLDRLKELLKSRYRLSDEEAERRLRSLGIGSGMAPDDARRGPETSPADRGRPEPRDESDAPAAPPAGNKPPRGR